MDAAAEILSMLPYGDGEGDDVTFGWSKDTVSPLCTKHAHA